MIDFSTLHDAFAEFERRADSVSSTTPGESVVRSRPARRSRVVLIAASVVAVVAIAGGAVLLAHRSDNRPPGQTAATPSISGQDSTTGPPTAASSIASTPSSKTSSTTAISTPSSAPAIPANPQQLTRVFRAALGDMAAITVTETGDQPGDPSIKGVLTASGAQGGYDFQILDVGLGSGASCEDPGRAVCHIRELPDGSSLSVGTESSGGLLYLVNLVRPDGTSLLWHLSTETDPKGAGPTLGTRPPLTTAKMAAILERVR